ncbi:MAG: polymer-forming cytoskeletal protein [Anaerolineae bacterium]|jgi:cytoskeletal protein CcmA (bactofilin family)|nr:polymer-forming cytoskeletal protein [Anaerolineae bacterium]
MSIFGGRKQQPSSPAKPSNISTPRSAPAMPSPPPRQAVGFETVLGASSTLHGDLKSQANIRLDGIFEGTLEIDGNVLVGETAKITADIHAKNVSIAGAVRGNVSGKKVQLLRTGRVWGDISATAIATEEGAFIDGKITMISHEAAQIFDPSTLPLPDEMDMVASEDERPPEDKETPDEPAQAPADDEAGAAE